MSLEELWITINVIKYNNFICISNNQYNDPKNRTINDVKDNP